MLVRDVFPFKDDVLPNKKEFKKRQGRYYRITELLELPPHRLQSCKLLSGHVPAVTRDLFASPPKMLLFLRDPVPRAISNLQYAQRRWHTAWSLSDILKNDILRTEYITNRQTQMLSFRSLEEARIYDRKIIPDRSRLELAEAKLKQSYVPKLHKVLPATKVARYIQIETKIRAIIRFGLAEKIPLAK